MVQSIQAHNAMRVLLVCTGVLVHINAIPVDMTAGTIPRHAAISFADMELCNDVKKRMMVRKKTMANMNPKNESYCAGNHKFLSSGPENYCARKPEKFNQFILESLLLRK